MKVLDGLEAVDPPLTQSVLTIGNFDGVHRAHQQLLAQAGLFAANTGGPVVALTFEPHPLSIVAPAKAPARLSTREQKLRYLARAGVDTTVIARSERSLLGLEAETFIDEVVRKRFHPTHIVEGPSFGFGRGRKGTAQMLRRIAAGFDCDVHIVEPVTLQVERGETLLVSSSLIRGLISEGKVHRAALCLGRCYELPGEVVTGDSRGREIGFPTANVAVSDLLIPGDGVYAGRAVVRGETHPCAISIGTTPTFGGTERRIEAHLLDFTGELYGEAIRLEFGSRLREQKTFDSAEALADQLKRDVAATHRVLDEVITDALGGEAGVL
ncbi:MAG: bifunctional riboflavin kinase/FAD synthetase [Planctomycetota bacterium]